MANRLIRVAIARADEAVTAKDLAFGIAEFRARKEDFPIYYGNSNVGIAGWLRRIDDTPDSSGVLWGFAEFTDEARQSIAAGKNTHIDPVWVWSYDGSAQRQGMSLLGLELTPDPFRNRSYMAAQLEELPPISLAETVGERGSEGGMAMADENCFSDPLKLDEYLSAEAKRRMKDKGTSFSVALKEIAAENPALVRLRDGLYRAGQARRHGTKHFEAISGLLGEVEGQIATLVRDAMKEHPELSYGQAMKKVAASEHDHLFRTRDQLSSYIYR